MSRALDAVGGSGLPVTGRATSEADGGQVIWEVRESAAGPGLYTVYWTEVAGGGGLASTHVLLTVPDAQLAALGEALAQHARRKR